MSEFSGANERIEPTPSVNPVHLHERNGFGMGAQSRKDPTNTVSGPSPGGFPPPTLLPPDLNLPPLPELYPPEFPAFPPGELPAPEGPGAPSNDAPPANGDFPFQYAEGGWWAYTSEVGWFKFTAPFPTSDPGGGQIWLSAT